jgi:hypothetical protein
VRRGADLRQIARHGHVYQASAEIGDLVRNKGQILPRLVGINDASTFWGFCQAHDTSTFAPLETHPFSATDEQVFLLAYRPLCKELYLKRWFLDSLNIARSTDQGRPEHEQLQIQEYVHLTGIGVRAAIRDLLAHKLEFDTELLANSFARIRHVTVHLDRVPDVLCSGIIQPHLTFDGRQIQNLADVNHRLQFMAVSAIATEDRGAVVFSWRPDSDLAANALIDSLLALKADAIPHAILRYVISEFENTYFRPEWWETRSSVERDAIVARSHHSVGPLNVVEADYLGDDGLRMVDWKIAGITEKRS